MILSLGPAGRPWYDLFSSHVHHSLPDTYAVTSFALCLSTNLDPGVFLTPIATAPTRNGPYLLIQKAFVTCTRDEAGAASNSRTLPSISPVRTTVISSIDTAIDAAFPDRGTKLCCAHYKHSAESTVNVVNVHAAADYEKEGSGCPGYPSYSSSASLRGLPHYLGWPTKSQTLQTRNTAISRRTCWPAIFLPYPNDPVVIIDLDFCWPIRITL